jgi:UPF0755 protein
MKTMKRIVLMLFVLASVGGLAAVWWIRARVREPYRGYAVSEQYVEVPAGAATRTIGTRLVDAGVIRDEPTFRAALWLSGDARRLQAGEYRFDRAMTPLEVIAKIARGDVATAIITFREGLTLAEMATVFESAGFGPSKGFVEAAQDSSLIKEIDPAAPDLEGYLFPDTYSVPRRTDAPRLVRVMVDRFRRILTAELRAAAEARGLTVRQLVTLASLVEKETGVPDERTLVAAVYSNRLRLGMGLQCDPTVIYALQRAGRYDGNLRRGDLMFDSPYNTYRYAGLPPGPIAAPGRGSLEAAARPADVDYLYFVSRNDGSHEFARTLAEHNRNVQRWQVQYFRDQRAGRAGGS